MYGMDMAPIICMTCIHVKDILNCFAIRMWAPFGWCTVNVWWAFNEKKMIREWFIFKQNIYALSETEDLPQRNLSGPLSFLKGSIMLSKLFYFKSFDVNSQEAFTEKVIFTLTWWNLSPKMLIFHQIITKRKSLSPNRSSGTETCFTERFYDGKILL